MPTYGDKRTSWKAPVQAVATDNIDITEPGAAIGGHTLAVGDSVLLTGQSTSSQNGVYVWAGAAQPMTRRDDVASADLIPNGATLVCLDGDYTGTIWACAALSQWGQITETPSGPALVGGTATIMATEAAATVTAATLRGAYGGKRVLLQIQGAEDDTLTAVYPSWSDDDLVITGNAVATADVTVTYVVDTRS